MKLSHIGRQCRQKQKWNLGSSHKKKKKKPAAKVLNEQNVANSTGKRWDRDVQQSCPFVRKAPVKVLKNCSQQKRSGLVQKSVQISSLGEAPGPRITRGYKGFKVILVLWCDEPLGLGWSSSPAEAFLTSFPQSPSAENTPSKLTYSGNPTSGCASRWSNLRHLLSDTVNKWWPAEAQLFPLEVLDLVGDGKGTIKPKLNSKKKLIFILTISIKKNDTITER